MSSIRNPRIVAFRFVIWEESDGHRSVNDIVEVAASGDEKKDKAMLAKRMRQFYDLNCDISTPLQEISVVFIREGEAGYGPSS